jgi:hypothetical protein
MTLLIVPRCGGDDDAWSPERRSDGLYEVTSLVVESPKSGGPMLCLNGAGASLPPVCGDVPIVGWDWNSVAGESTMGRVKFGTYALVGEYDGETFTVTQPPRPATLG